MTLHSPIKTAEAAKRYGASDTRGLRPLAAIAPLVDLSKLGTFYVPSSHMDEVDPAAMATYLAYLKPVEDLLNATSFDADRYVVAVPARPDIAASVLAAILPWAKADAMLGGLSEITAAVDLEQAYMTQSWYGVGLCIVYAKVKDAADLARADLDAVAKWLRTLAYSVLHYSLRTDRPAWAIGPNNHTNAHGAFLGLWGSLSGDQRLFDAAMGELDRALDEVGPDGSLPSEMWRGSKARHYQHFAMLYIGYMIATADACNRPLTEEREAAFQRAAAFTMTSVDDLSVIAQHTTSKQDVFAPADLAWIEAALSHMRAHSPALAVEADAMAAPARPLSHLPFTGGKLTGLF